MNTTTTELRAPFVQHENGDVLSGPGSTVIASWHSEYDGLLHISRETFAQLLSAAEELERAEEHLSKLLDLVGHLEHSDKTIDELNDEAYNEAHTLFNEASDFLARRASKESR